MSARITAKTIDSAHKVKSGALEQAEAQRASVEAERAQAVGKVRHAALMTASTEIVDRVCQGLLDEIAAGRHPYPGVARTEHTKYNQYERMSDLEGHAAFRIQLSKVPSWSEHDGKTNQLELDTLTDAVKRQLADRGFTVAGVDASREGFGGERHYVEVYLKDPQWNERFGVGTKLGQLVDRWFGSNDRRIYMTELMFPTGSRDTFAYQGSVR